MRGCFLQLCWDLDLERVPNSSSELSRQDPVVCLFFPGGPLIYGFLWMFRSCWTLFDVTLYLDLNNSTWLLPSAGYGSKK
uniref:Uncharacterized protein n=1 Tax=Arundo donax TaxID=35708 RepID=A0A0A8YGH4_ARUDO